MTTRERERSIARLWLFGIFAVMGACASSPPPASSSGPVMVVPVIDDPPAPAAPPEGGPSAAAETPSQTEAECQGPDECKTRGEPARGFQWICDGGRCMEQAVERPNADEDAVAGTKDKPHKKAKAKGPRKQ